MTKKAVNDLARSLRSHSKRVTAYHTTTRHAQYATVLSTDPWEVELHDGQFLLAEEDLTVSQWVEKYDVEHGVDEGDTVLVTEMPNGDWVVHDVIADKAVT